MTEPPETTFWAYNPKDDLVHAFEVDPQIVGEGILTLCGKLVIEEMLIKDTFGGIVCGNCKNLKDFKDNNQ